MPAIQMAGMLFNNTLYYFDCNYKLAYMLDYILGNSIFTCIFLYIASYTFKFCNWYRLIIIANLINITIASYDVMFRIPITDITLLSVYYVIYGIAITIAIIIHIKSNNHVSKNTTNQKVTRRSDN